MAMRNNREAEKRALARYARACSYDFTNQSRHSAWRFIQAALAIKEKFPNTANAQAIKYHLLEGIAKRAGIDLPTRFPKITQLFSVRSK
jgi:hypothetical protein